MTTWKRYSRVADLQLDTPNGYLFVQHARVNPDCGIPVYIVDDRVGVNLITNEAFRSQGKASFKDLQDCVVRFDSQDAEGLWDGSKHYPLEKTEISLSKDVHDKISEYDLPSLDRRTRLLHLYFHYPWNLEPLILFKSTPNDYYLVTYMDKFTRAITSNILTSLSCHERIYYCRNTRHN